MAENSRQTRSDAYPMAFAALLPMLKEKAKSMGYALAVHGSMARDLDLIAVPWTNDAWDPHDLAELLRNSCCGIPPLNLQYLPTLKPHGRLSWAFYLDVRSALAEDGPYVDLSVIPPVRPTP